MSKTSIERLPDARLQRCRASGATMGTRWSAQFHFEPGLDVDRVVAELGSAVATVDAQMSNWREDSDLARLNRAASGQWVDVPAELAHVLDRALGIGRDTGNAFNIGVGALAGAWGFGPGRGDTSAGAPGGGAAPVLQGALDIDVANRRARRNAEVALDLCGIAKGFGVDALGRVLGRHGIASWLVGIDGEMRARGRKPDGTPWAIAIEAPGFERRAAMGVIELEDAAVATSGDYRHWRDTDAGRIAHTMDPRTGEPVRNGVASVTVLAQDCMDADAHATALLVLGEHAGRAWAERHGLDMLMLVRGEGGIIRTIATGVFAAWARAGAD